MVLRQNSGKTTSSGNGLSSYKIVLTKEKKVRGQQAVLSNGPPGDIISNEALWACTTCYACDQEYPLFIEHIPLIMDMRRYLLTQQRAMWSRTVKPKIKDIRKEPALNAHCPENCRYRSQSLGFCPILPQRCCSLRKVAHLCKINLDRRPVAPLIFVEDY